MFDTANITLENQFLLTVKKNLITFNFSALSLVILIKKGTFAAREIYKYCLTTN
jgi:hypothetical protein